MSMFLHLQLAYQSMNNVPMTHTSQMVAQYRCNFPRFIVASWSFQQVNLRNPTAKVTSIT